MTAIVLVALTTSSGAAADASLASLVVTLPPTGLFSASSTCSVFTTDDQLCTVSLTYLNTNNNNYWPPIPKNVSDVVVNTDACVTVPFASCTGRDSYVQSVSCTASAVGGVAPNNLMTAMSTTTCIYSLHIVGPSSLPNGIISFNLIQPAKRTGSYVYQPANILYGGVAAGYTVSAGSSPQSWWMFVVGLVVTMLALW